MRRRAARTARPPRVAMRARKPCVFARFRTLGWYVRFTVPPWCAPGSGQSPTIICVAATQCQRTNVNPRRTVNSQSVVTFMHEQAFCVVIAAAHGLIPGGRKSRSKSVDTVENAGLTLVEPVDNFLRAVVDNGPHCYDWSRRCGLGSETRFTLISAVWHRICAVCHSWRSIHPLWIATSLTGFSSHQNRAREPFHSPPLPESFFPQRHERAAPQTPTASSSLPQGGAWRQTGFPKCGNACG